MQDKLNKLNALEDKVPVANYIIPIENKKIALMFSGFCIATLVLNVLIIVQGFSAILMILRLSFHIFNILGVVVGLAGALVDLLMVIQAFKANQVSSAGIAMLTFHGVLLLVFMNFHTDLSFGGNYADEITQRGITTSMMMYAKYLSLIAFLKMGVCLYLCGLGKSAEGATEDEV